MHAKVGLTFAASLRSILRHDPDVILVGEIRDLETAENAIQASLTGHLVFSTLHTNDAAGAFMRLVDMGVEPFLVSSTVEGVMAQRLVRTLCRECREPLHARGATTCPTTFPLDECLRAAASALYRAGGLPPAAAARATAGRVGLYELLVTNDEIRRLASERAPAQRRQAGRRDARACGRCAQDGWRKVAPRPDHRRRSAARDQGRLNAYPKSDTIQVE